MKDPPELKPRVLLPRPPRPAASADQAVAAVVAQPAKRAMLVAACRITAPRFRDTCKSATCKLSYNVVVKYALSRVSVFASEKNQRHQHSTA